jgi:hypothetical protein
MTDIEIIFDHKWEASGAGLVMNENHEVCPDGEWIRYARRLTGIKDLFVYHHKLEGTWVLCKWLYKPSETDSPVALELATMPLPPDMPGSGRLVGDALKYRLRPAEDMVEEMKRNARDAASHKETMRQERIGTKQQAVKYMKGHGMERGAQMLEDGACGWMAPSESRPEYQEMVTELVSMAKKGS